MPTNAVIRVTCPMCEGWDVEGVIFPEYSPKVLFWECQICTQRWNRYSPDKDEGLARLGRVLMRADYGRA